MGMKNCTIRVETRPTLVLSGIYFQSLGVWPTKTAAIPIDEAVLTEPERGPQGGFKYAELRDSTGVRWTFDNGDRHFYKEVKAILEAAKAQAK